MSFVCVCPEFGVCDFVCQECVRLCVLVCVRPEFSVVCVPRVYVCMCVLNLVCVSIKSGKKRMSAVCVHLLSIVVVVLCIRVHGVLFRKRRSLFHCCFHLEFILVCPELKL